MRYLIFSSVETISLYKVTHLDRNVMLAFFSSHQSLTVIILFYDRSRYSALSFSFKYTYISDTYVKNT